VIIKDLLEKINKISVYVKFSLFSWIIYDL